MKIRVLGSGAGGGIPQWNCNYRFSQRARAGDPAVPRRTQSSIAVSANGKDWVLVNASPDIGQQLLDTPVLHPDPRAGLRSSPIRAVVVTNADVDHIAGLLTLRERQPFNLYASAPVLAALDANPIFRVLDPGLVPRLELPLGRRIAIEGPSGPTGVFAEAYAVTGKVALFMEDSGDPSRFVSEGGDTIGLALSVADGPVAHYVPGCAAIDDRLRSRIDHAGALLFDGTVWTDTEMADAGVGEKTGRRMGHIPISGADGSLEGLRSIEAGRKVFVHINNTNPILDETSAEHRAAEAAGWEIGRDGMEIDL